MSRFPSPLGRAAVLLAALLGAAPATAEEELLPDVAVAPPRVAPITAIAIKSREIRLSPTLQRTTTTFVNDTAAEVATLVAMSLPRLDAATAGLDGLVRGAPGAADFIGVRVAVDGKPVEPRADVRASVLGLDVTDRLKADGVPLDPWTTPRIDEILAKLPADKRPFYVAHGLAQWFEGGPGAFGWDVATTLHWIQAFPPGKPVTVVEDHAPLVGTGLVTLATVDRWAAHPGCLDKASEAALRKALAAGRPAGADPGTSTALMQRRVRLALGPDTVGAFRLVVEKPKPETLVIACWPAEPKKPTAEAVVVEASNFTATADLDVVFVDPPAQK